MTKRLAVGVMVVLGVVWSAAARGATAPQPGPEQKRLEYFVGKWRVDTDFKATATTPAWKASGTEDCEWFANLHVTCRAESTGPAGLYKSLRVMSYAAALKKYSTYTVDSIGYAVFTLGTLQGSTWTFASDLGGLKTQIVMKTAGDTYDATSQYAGADGKWVTTATMKATRIK